MMVDSVNESNTLDIALNFNSENIFEYIETLLNNNNADIIGVNAENEMKKVYEYINTLDLSDSDSVIFDIEDIANSALTQNAHDSYRAGFIEACRLLKTLQSF